MVRIQRRVSKKHYLKTKRTYEYERMSLDIPKKFHEIMRPLVKQDFDLNVVAERNRITIILTTKAIQ